MNEYHVAVVGGDNAGTKSHVRVINEQESVLKGFYGRDTKFTQVTLVKTKNKIRNLVVGTDRGGVRIFNVPLSEALFDEFSVHYGELTNLLSSPDGQFVFSAGVDGSLFVYSVTEYADEKNMLKSSAIAGA